MCGCGCVCVCVGVGVVCVWVCVWVWVRVSKIEREGGERNRVMASIKSYDAKRP